MSHQNCGCPNLVRIAAGLTLDARHTSDAHPQYRNVNQGEEGGKPFIPTPYTTAVCLLRTKYMLYWTELHIHPDEQEARAAYRRTRFEKLLQMRQSTSSAMV